MVRWLNIAAAIISFGFGRHVYLDEKGCQLRFVVGLGGVFHGVTA